MRFSKLMSLACALAAFLGFLVTASFGSYPYPSEATGTACAGPYSQPCGEVPDVTCINTGYCNWCSGSSSFSGNMCVGTTTTQSCLTTGSTSVNCGDEYTGFCTRGGTDNCTNAMTLIKSGGCNAVTIQCSGTQ